MTSSNRINKKFMPSHKNERPMQEILLMFDYLIFSCYKIIMLFGLMNYCLY